MEEGLYLGTVQAHLLGETAAAALVAGGLLKQLLLLVALLLYGGNVRQLAIRLKVRRHCSS